jgi:tRNA-2-methylthio-N6-dimethylallyladenosine synthase
MKTYHITTIGCQMNKADSERLAYYLEDRGWQAASSPLKTRLAILVTCGVRQSAEDRIYGLAHQIKKKNPKVILVITGCLSDRPDVRSRLKSRVDIWLPIAELPSLSALLEKIDPSLKNHAVGTYRDYLEIGAKYESPWSAFIPVGNGCNNFCSYCVVPYARGREVYRPASEIIKEAKALIKRGYREITLIAQNVNSYRSPAKDRSDFADVLKAVAAIPGDFWLRFATSHPKDMSAKLIRTIGATGKICPQVHLAVQSGDDEVLRAMNRKYTAAHFLGLVEKIRAAKPGVAISTDTIVGFPGETKAQFNNTVKLFRAAKFDLAFIARYSPRFGTVSAKMEDDVPMLEKKRREQALEKILKQTALGHNKTYLKQTVRVLIEGRDRHGVWYGRTGSFKTVRVHNAPDVDLSGKFIAVKIKEVRDFELSGEML